MMLELTDQERDLLLERLQSELSEMRVEVSNTDVESYRTGLKEERAILERIMEKLRAQVTVPYDEAMEDD